MLLTRLPFQRHLKWLCLEGLPADAIQSYYDNIQLVQPTSVQIAACVEETKQLIIPPATKKRLAKKIYSAEDELLWRKHGFEEIYLHQVGKQPFKELGKVLNHSVLRVALECCLVAGIPKEELSQLLPSVYYLEVSVETIDLFIKYFFEYLNLTKRDWQSYLGQLSEDRYTHTRLFFALTRPQEEVLHAVGLPSRTQFGTMLKNVMNTAHYRFEYYARQQSPEAQEEARKWAKLMMDAGVRHEKFGATDATDFSKLIQTEFEYLDAHIENVTPEMLAGAKPPALESPDAVQKPEIPAPPDLTQQSGLRNDI